MRLLTLFCVVVASLAALYAPVAALSAQAAAKAELSASQFAAYIDRFYPGGRSGAHAATIEAITNGLRRGDVTLGALVQVAETFTEAAELQAEDMSSENLEEALDADSEEEGEADADEDADADAEEEAEADEEEASFLASSTSARTSASAAATARTGAGAATAARASNAGAGAPINATAQAQTAADRPLDAAAPPMQDAPLRGPNGCLVHNGQECNGERAGACVGGVCHCIAGWTGLRCQVDWALAKLNPYTGFAEGTPECANTAAQYMSSCS